MRIPHSLLRQLLPAFITFPLLAADTRCPPDTHRLAVTTPNVSGRQFVACGDPVGNVAVAVRSNALEIYEAGVHDPILSFDGTEEALLYPSKTELRVVLVCKYPAGRAWSWVEVPVAEWKFSVTSPRPAPEPRFPPLGVENNEVSAFLRSYHEWLKQPRADDAISDRTEEMLGRLAAAATAGYEQAQKSFATIARDAHLDGAFGEEFEYYWAYYAWVQPTAARKWPRPANCCVPGGCSEPGD